MALLRNDKFKGLIVVSTSHVRFQTLVGGAENVGVRASFFCVKHEEVKIRPEQFSQRETHRERMTDRYGTTKPSSEF